MPSLHQEEDGTWLISPIISVCRRTIYEQLTGLLWLQTLAYIRNGLAVCNSMSLRWYISSSPSSAAASLSSLSSKVPASDLLGLLLFFSNIILHKCLLFRVHISRGGRKNLIQSLKVRDIVRRNEKCKTFNYVHGCIKKTKGKIHLDRRKSN